MSTFLLILSILLILLFYFIGGLMIRMVFREKLWLDISFGAMFIIFALIDTVRLIITLWYAN